MLKINNNNKYKNVDTTDNVILAFSLIKFTDIPQFTSCVVTCIPISNMDFFLVL